MHYNKINIIMKTAAIKKTEFMSSAETWMNLEPILLSKLTQEQTIKCRMFSLIVGVEQ